MKKVFSILMIVLMMVCISTSVFATAKVDIGKVETQAESGIDTNAATSLEKFGGTIIAYITNAAMIIAVVMVAVLGIKYMMGSAEEKAEYKKSFVPLLVGAILVFGAATVAKIIVGLAGSF